MFIKAFVEALVYSQQYTNTKVYLTHFSIFLADRKEARLEHTIVHEDPSHFLLYKSSLLLSTVKGITNEQSNLYPYWHSTFTI